MADVLTVRPGRGVGQVRLCLATRDAAAYAADVPVSGTGWQEVRVPLTNFRPAAPLLVPRPYPGFLPLPYAAPAPPAALKLADAEALQAVPGAAPAGAEPLTVDIESMVLADAPRLPAGPHVLALGQGPPLAPGAYLVQLQAGGTVTTRPLLVR